MYFEQFPQINYNGTLCTDITRRVKLSDETKKALTSYYSYEVKDGKRADIISNAYYDDPTLDWLLWLANDVVDPYYQWNLSENDFHDYLIKTYGSVENAQEKILFYRNNWYNDDQLITPEFYNNTLNENWKKYYAPFFGNGTNVLHWQRREEDWVMETNEIWKCDVANSNLEVGDLIVMGMYDASPAIIISSTVFGGEISAIEDTTHYIKNVTYTVDPITLDRISLQSETNLKMISNTELVYRAIPLDEGGFWSSVSYYDIEEEKNVYNKSIRILDKAFVLPTTESIRRKLRE